MTINFDEDWCAQQGERNVHFDYWLNILSLDHVSCACIILLNEGNFNLYLQSLAQVVPWMFALYQTHYSRCLSIHIRDMMSLPVNHPKQSCRVACLKNCCAQQAASFQQWPSFEVMSRIMASSKYHMPKNRGNAWSVKIGCSIWRVSGGLKTSNQTQDWVSSSWR